MQNNKKRKINYQSGAAMLVSVVFFLFISLAIIAGLVSPSVRGFQIANTDFNSKKSYFLAESGIEDASYRIIKNKTIDSSETITIGSNSATTTITPNGYNKIISSLGDVLNLQRKVGATLTTGAGVGLNYGIQAGTGGFTLSGGSTIWGNVYSNGNIQASSGVVIKNSAIAAGATSYIGDGVGSPYTGTVVIGSAGVGDAWAYRALGASVAGNLYCQIPATYPTGNKNNKACNTSRGIPPTASMPFTDENMNNWKNTAAAGGIITGATKCPGGYSSGNCTVNYAGATFGPGKITGNLTVNGGGTLTLTGAVWVVGNVTVTGGGKIKLPTNYALNSETIISDGLVSIAGGGSGSGTTGSYLFVVSTSTSNSAITVSGGAGAIAVVAQNGTVALSGSASLKSAVGNKVTATTGTNVYYEQGLASPSFINGPTGSWLIGGWGEKQ